MPEGFMPKSRSSGTAQARLERGRQQRAQNGSSDMSPTEKSAHFPTGAYKRQSNEKFITFIWTKNS